MHHNAVHLEQEVWKSNIELKALSSCELPQSLNTMQQPEQSNLFCWGGVCHKILKLRGPWHKQVLAKQRATTVECRRHGLSLEHHPAGQGTTWERGIGDIGINPLSKHLSLKSVQLLISTSYAATNWPYFFLTGHPSNLSTWCLG